MNSLPETVQYDVFIPNWECRLTVLMIDSGPFVMIREVCGIIGLKNIHVQIGSLRERRATANYVRQLPVQTPTRGRQVAWCIHQRALGYWLGYVDERRVRTEVVERLVEFQQDVMEAAHRLLFGIVDESVVETLPSNVTRLSDRFGYLPKTLMPDDDDS